MTKLRLVCTRSFLRPLMNSASLAPSGRPASVHLSYVALSSAASACAKLLRWTTGQTRLAPIASRTAAPMMKMDKRMRRVDSDVSLSGRLGQGHCHSHPIGVRVRHRVTRKQTILGQELSGSIESINRGADSVHRVAEPVRLFRWTLC